MNHSHPATDSHHPKTFDEVIARGFRFERRETPRQPRVENIRNRTIPGAPVLPSFAAPTAVGALRKDANAGFNPDEQAAFRNAVLRLVEEGRYRELVGYHMDMSHKMHGSMGEVGLYRFLGWHRRYLLEFERELQRVDAILRPTATEKLGIPFWRWQDPFPAWMNGFLPAPNPDTGLAPPPRKNAAPPDKANAADVDIIVNQFQTQRTGLPDENDYTRFTYGLEGWGRRPNGTRLPAHNHGHAWIGGIMNNTSTSPTDPIFWLHHAEVDRLWQIWRQANPNPAPLLTDAELVMDPWAESYDDLLDIGALGYGYATLAL